MLRLWADEDKPNFDASVGIHHKLFKLLLARGCNHLEVVNENQAEVYREIFLERRVYEALDTITNGNDINLTGVEVETPLMRLVGRESEHLDELVTEDLTNDRLSTATRT